MPLFVVITTVSPSIETCVHAAGRGIHDQMQVVRGKLRASSVCIIVTQISNCSQLVLSEVVVQNCINILPEPQATRGKHTVTV